MLFGELMQCKLIMEKNFEGKQLFIPAQEGKTQPVIDCMFFPATHGDIIQLDPDLDEMEHYEIGNPP